MDRSVIQQRLAETDEQIANGVNQIAQRRRLIAELQILTARFDNSTPPRHARDGGAKGGPPHGMRLRRTALTAHKGGTHTGGWA